MKTTTKYPSRVWNFAVVLSTILTFIFCDYLIHFTFSLPKAMGISDRLMTTFVYLIINIIQAIPLYFCFKISVNYLIQKERSRFNQKVAITLVGSFFSIIIFFAHLSFIAEMTPLLVLFFISLIFGIWFFKIDDGKDLVNPLREDILDDGFHSL